MRLIYNGPAEGVTILATGQKVKRGEPADIADPDVAVSLIAQGWKPAKKSPAKKSPARKSKAKSANEPKTEKDA